jgi:hypothetical protein
MRLLAALCSDGRGRAVSRKTGISQATLRGLLTGSVPKERARAALWEHCEIPLAAWDAPLAPGDGVVTAHFRGMPPPAMAAPKEEAVAADDEADLSALGQIRETLSELRKDRDRVRLDPNATPRDRAAIANALASATRLLAKVDGAGSLTMSQILRSEHWVKLRDGVLGVLSAHPAALSDVSDFLRSMAE